ncbi:hypothetical protein BDQ12DRAFT_729069 [Crucibulum laeve]|uniref:Uncharacterized protein n=1 Tax=Crucibulum laeve TaxID=68775 RepID=A0A5C3LGY9_9AGAR|nr:hypothetical protein BDQ12DRAFT_729069 [Crucibulum laeve]
MFTEETHQFIRQLACEKDTTEKDKLNEIVQFNEDKIVKKVTKKKDREKQATDFASHIAKVALETNKDSKDKMAADTLRDQFDVFKAEGASMPDKMTRNSRVGELKEAIKSAIDALNRGDWHLSSDTIVAEKDQQNDECIDKVALDFNKDSIDKMRGDALRGQFDAFKAKGAPIPNKITRNSTVGELKKAIKSAINSLKRGNWHLNSGTVVAEEAQEEDGEYFEGYDDVPGSENDWTDEENSD